MLGAVRPDCVEPTPFSASFAAATSGATSLVASADFPVGTYLPAGWELAVITPTGAQVNVTVATTLNVTAAGVTTLAVEALAAALPVGSTLAYPQVFASRERAALSTSITRPTTVTLDSNGATQGLNVANDTTIDLAGNYLSNDPAFRNFRTAALGTDTQAPQDVYMWFIDVPANATLTHGEVWHGQVNTTGFSKEVTSTEITKANCQAAFNGRPIIEAPGSTANGYFGIAGLP